MDEAGRGFAAEEGIQCRLGTGRVVTVVSLGAGMYVNHATGVGRLGIWTKEAEVRYLVVPKGWGVGIRVGWVRVWVAFGFLGRQGGIRLTPRVVIPRKERGPKWVGRIRIRLAGCRVAA